MTYPRHTPDESVPPSPRFPAIEEQILAFWREDGTFSGGWRPNPGADETVNVPYDISGRRVG